jgi:long-chain acyl-CoA synthetase
VDSPRGFWAAAAAEPDRVAIVEPDGTTHTAGQVVAAANRLVHHLRSMGLGAGDPVATLLPNGVATFQVLLAVMQAGMQYVPLNTNLTLDEIAYVLDDAGAKVLVTDHEIDTATPQLVTPLDAVLAPHPSTAPEDRVAGQFMQYTSGTTGRPKAVLRDLPSMTPEQWAAAFATNLTRYGIEPGGDAVHLVTSPMYHMAPLSFGLFSAHFEHPVVLMAKWDAEAALQLIERHRVTDVHMVPTQLHRLMQLPEPVRARYDVSSLRQVLHAAAPCPRPLKERLFEWLGPVIYEFYGATEGGGTFCTPQEWLDHPGTVGKPWPGAGVRILDDDGDDVPTGTVGTVYLKLLGEFAYKGDPDKTAAGRREGWFTVGDVGEVDDDGFLYLRDRKIDMIISGGINIYPAEIEGVLLEHPAVGDAAVFGVPDEEWGEAVKAVVELNEPIDVEELLAHCRDRLARYKLPRSIDVTDAMPRDPNGKLYKRTLREPYWAGRERSI